jgi:hypothetical protein
MIGEDETGVPPIWKQFKEINSTTKLSTKPRGLRALLFHSASIEYSNSYLHISYSSSCCRVDFCCRSTIYVIQEAENLHLHLHSLPPLFPDFLFAMPSVIAMNTGASIG